jgi:Na+:H+ antiporter, NhaA family
MHRDSTQRPLPRAHRIARKAFTALDHFLHIEAASGIVLLAAAVAALIWANSPYAHEYEALWEMPLSFGAGHFTFSRSLHFWINDALMTVFFLVVGIEIRREMHEGTLSDLRQAVLPLAAAVGGVVAPAVIYLLVNHGSGAAARGWAVPTATDIAFAVGVLALLGRSIPGNVRIFLLTLAIVDDIIAVLIIACFYSTGLDYTGFAISAAGIALVVVMQRIGIGNAFAYVVPGAVIWAGLLVSGAHPTLAGVILGLMTPVVPTRRHERALVELSRAANDVTGDGSATGDLERLAKPLQSLRLAQRDLLPPVLRVQWSLHPWVAYAIMPLFAFANAGVSVTGSGMASGEARWVLIGVALALVVGKPLGVFTTSWMLVKAGLCRLPTGVTWHGVALIALLAGIGFTMSVFIAMLAFDAPDMLAAAKLGVLIGSLVAGTFGLLWGAASAKRLTE